MAKNGYLCDCLLPWQQPPIYSYERKWNPRCVPNLHCECQDLKPKVETNTSFSVRHPFSGVDTVKTVRIHHKYLPGEKWNNNFFNSDKQKLVLHVLTSERSSHGTPQFLCCHVCMDRNQPMTSDKLFTQVSQPILLRLN